MRGEWPRSGCEAQPELFLSHVVLVLGQGQLGLALGGPHRLADFALADPEPESVDLAAIFIDTNEESHALCSSRPGGDSCDDAEGQSGQEHAASSVISLDPHGEE